MIRKLKEEVKEGYYAMSFIQGEDCARYGKLLEELDNDYIKGTDSYPNTVSVA